jgi:hypothetical protein
MCLDQLFFFCKNSIFESLNKLSEADVFQGLFHSENYANFSFHSRTLTLNNIFTLFSSLSEYKTFIDPDKRFFFFCFALISHERVSFVFFYFHLKENIKSHLFLFG